MTQQQKVPPPRDATPVIGIGTGASNLAPLAGLLKRIVREDVAVVVVFETGPPPGAIDTITRASRLPVEKLEREARVAPGRVYLCPSEKDVALSDGVLRLDEPRSAERLPIDAFFRTVAAERTGHSIGVLLSGTGADGALGLDAIRAADGITLLLTPTALDTGCADFSGTTEELGDELTRILAHPYLARSAWAETKLSAEALGRVFALLRAAFAHDLSLYKQGTILRRIERRMALRRSEHLDDYVRVLQSDTAELSALYRDLLIGVTSFFRDGEPFEALKETVFPTILSRRHDSPVRIWVPGCSTGEEAYSIAMCLLEVLGEDAPEPVVQIFATDVDDAAIERARRGIYPSNIALDVSPERLQRFFVKKDGGYQVCRRVRDLLVFATQNVTKDPPYSRLDLISCRNLLIYLQQPLQRKVLRIFHYALNPGGSLLLGTSETAGDSTDLFSTVDRRHKIYAKRDVVSAAANFEVNLEPSRPLAYPPRLPGTLKPKVTVQQLADRRVLDRFGPPGVVVNQNLDVIQFRGRTGPYLDPAPGVATLNVLKLARTEIALELRGAIQRCQREGLPAITKEVLVPGKDGPERIQIDVTPIEVPDQESTCLLILFVPIDALLAPPAAEEPPPSPNERRRSEELAHELVTTKQYLQTTIEELESANEELQSANEELQSANEELQSTNEEIETSKEELQSTNEELTTVNDELQTRMEELSLSNDDLHNVFASLDAPLIIVDTDLRLRRFSFAAERLLDLQPADVGRPLAHVRSFSDVPDLERVVATVVETVTPQILEVRTGAEKRVYELRISPYKTANHLIKGALLSFVDVEGLRRHAGPDLAVQTLGRALVGDAPHAALILDPSMRVSWANEAFLRTFDQREDALLGRLLQHLGAPWSDWRLRANLERTSLEGTAFKDLRVSHPDKAGSPRDLVLSGSRVQLSPRDPAMLGNPVLLLALHDGRKTS